MPNHVELYRDAMALNRLASAIADTAEEKGFWTFDHIGLEHEAAAIPLKLALVASEVSEALDVHRKDYHSGPVNDFDHDIGMNARQAADFTEELADVIIRVLDLSGYFDLHIGEVVAEKMAKNEERPYRHGKRY